VAILHIGDSLMYQSAQNIQWLEVVQNNAVLPMFNAVPGGGLRHVDYWRARIGYIQAQVDVDLVFISLGSNDIHDSGEGFSGQSEIENEIAELLSSFPKDTRIYWILPHSNVEKLWSTDSHYTIVREAIFHARNSGNWPNLKTLDFDQWVSSQHKSLRNALAEDGIHLSQAGKVEWALMIRNVVNTEYPN